LPIDRFLSSRRFGLANPYPPRSKGVKVTDASAPDDAPPTANPFP
jgi:hypothetical protein